MDRTSSPSRKPPRVKTLVRLAQESALALLWVELDHSKPRGGYCCGSTLPIDRFAMYHKASSSGRTSQKVIMIRWDTLDDDGTARKVVLPISESSDPTQNRNRLEELLKSCTSTRSMSSEDQKLDRSRFSIDFHPQDFSILDALNQIFHAQADCGQLTWEAEHQGISCELRHLSIGSRSLRRVQPQNNGVPDDSHVGILMICLPHPHEGGQLCISRPDPICRNSRNGRDRIIDWDRVSQTGHISQKFRPSTFDWSRNANEIQWAAWFDDCEAEIQNVTSGQQVTLTYDLYTRDRVGIVLRRDRNPVADPTLYRLYTKLRNVLKLPGFMKNGGTIGYYCDHKYVHNHRKTKSLMPAALKGIDAITFATFQALGLNLAVHPVLCENGMLEQIRFIRDVETSDDDQHFERPCFETRSVRVGHAFHEVKYDNNDGHVLHFEGIHKPYKSTATIFSRFANSHAQMLPDQWPHTERHDISWMNEVSYRCEEKAIVMVVDRDHVRDSNFEESVVAILIDVPPYLERNLPSTGSSGSGDSLNGSRGNSNTQEPMGDAEISNVEMEL